MHFAIEAEGLVKKFGNTFALNGVDLAARTGTVLGVLGPNGAGKTTAIRIMATLLQPDAGHATVAGYDIVREAHRVRQLIGLTGQYASVDEGLSGMTNLILIGRLLGLRRAECRARGRELLARFGLADVAGRPVRTYSGGMRRRLDLAASVVGRPKVLYLDEPTTGLDPHSRNEVWSLVRDLTGEGVTVLLTTQYLEEADQLAHEVVLIDHGKVIANGTPNELKAKTGGQVLEIRPADPAQLLLTSYLVADRTGGTPSTSPDGEVLTVPIASAKVLPDVIQFLDKSGIELAEFALRRTSLDEVFLTLTGRRA
jgi:oleandomycin transport system ATP-binding protein